MDNDRKYFLPYQYDWITDPRPLKIAEKSRQIGITFADAYHSVRIASNKGARYDVFVSSRDKFQAKLYIEDCKNWGQVLEILTIDLGEIVFDQQHNASAYVIQFSNGRRIYSLSSHPDALAGKRGHVKLDEFALHQDQRLLYSIAKPVTTWGGTLSIMSTHRGAATVFNQIIRDILENDNPMKWSLHTISLETAVAQGLVERINEKTQSNESREQFLQRLRKECIDEEQWMQEYCCIPADESAVFLSYDLITACEDRNLALLSFAQLVASLASAPDHQLSTINHQLFLGVDVARINNLCVIYVVEKIGDVMWDRLRIELQNKTFSEIEFELYRLLALPQLKRACIDSTGIGMQLAERARQQFGWKVEPVHFTPAVKEDLAFGLRAALEDRKVRLVRDDKLRADLRGLRKELTSSGNIRFCGESADSHCDRTWAMALAHHAARHRPSAGGCVC